MGSPNGNHSSRGHSKSMQRNFTCNECGKKYAMEWAKNNHQRLCKEGSHNQED